jgi:hypothetical protein
VAAAWRLHVSSGDWASASSNSRRLRLVQQPRISWGCLVSSFKAGSRFFEEIVQQFLVGADLITRVKEFEKSDYF